MKQVIPYDSHPPRGAKSYRSGKYLDALEDLQQVVQVADHEAQGNDDQPDRGRGVDIHGGWVRGVG